MTYTLRIKGTKVVTGAVALPKVQIGTIVLVLICTFVLLVPSFVFFRAQKKIF